ncbi:hypothetical protein [Subtercola sp. YIM 133946]|uniref:hypothetical protein n=1 Tax=Subtercola sp. YIM 133946 TaxID=3118909 RepID=UPI002F9531AA
MTHPHAMVGHIVLTNICSGAGCIRGYQLGTIFLAIAPIFVITISIWVARPARRLRSIAVGSVVALAMWGYLICELIIANPWATGFWVWQQQFSFLWF